LFAKAADDMHHGVVDLLAVWLTQADDENAAVRGTAVFGEPFGGMFSSTRIVIRQRLAT
jgi:hypothetical protein